jgi:superfamily II DNA helicase RecQ
MAQFEKMISWCQSAGCRMVSLVRYFGDSTDSKKDCGVCDFCDSESTLAQSYRPASTQERAAVEQIVAALNGNDGATTGRLYTHLFADRGMDRRSYEELLNAMARAKLIDLEEAAFEKDGKRIEFRKAWLLPAASEEDAAKRVMLPVDIEGAPSARPTARRKRARTKDKAAAVQVSRDARVEAALKMWRKDEATKLGVPAFRVLTDRMLIGIAAAEPANEEDLLEVPGIGPRLVAKFGNAILRIVNP